MNAKIAKHYLSPKKEIVVCIVPMELWPVLLFKKVQVVVINLDKSIKL